MNREYSYFYIYTSIVIAIFLSITPLPDYFLIIRFDWIVLIVLFWLLAEPEKFSLISVWACGIIIDIMNSNILGQNAFSLLIVAFAVLVWHRQIKTMPVLQQSIIVGCLIIIYRLIDLWLNGIIGITTPNMLIYFLSPLLSIFIWPLIFSLLSMYGNKTRRF
jgi:rod shape-determining protein MreD